MLPSCSNYWVASSSLIPENWKSPKNKWSDTFIPIPQESTTHCPKASLVHGALVCHWLIDNPAGISVPKGLMLHLTIFTASLNGNGSCMVMHTIVRGLLAPLTFGNVIRAPQRIPKVCLSWPSDNASSNAFRCWKAEPNASASLGMQLGKTRHGYLDENCSKSVLYVTALNIQWILAHCQQIYSIPQRPHTISCLSIPNCIEKINLIARKTLHLALSIVKILNYTANCLKSSWTTWNDMCEEWSYFIGLGAWGAWSKHSCPEQFPYLILAYQPPCLATEPSKKYHSMVIHAHINHVQVRQQKQHCDENKVILWNV